MTVERRTESGLKMKQDHHILAHDLPMGFKQKYLLDDDLSGYSTKSSIDLDATEASK